MNKIRRILDNKNLSLLSFEKAIKHAFKREVTSWAYSREIIYGKNYCSYNGYFRLFTLDEAKYFSSKYGYKIFSIKYLNPSINKNELYKFSCKTSKESEYILYE